jgi:hypothetical protein
MYNIDLSFLEKIKSNSNFEQFERNHNNVYKENLINKICPNFHSDTECSECNNHEHTYTNLDKRNIIEVTCDGLLGNSYCEIELDSKVDLVKNDMVVISVNSATEIAFVDEIGDIVRLRRQRLDLLNEDVPKVLRKATDNDIAKYQTKPC